MYKMYKKNSDKKEEDIEELTKQITKIYAENFTTNCESDKKIAEFILSNYERKY